MIEERTNEELDMLFDKVFVVLEKPQEVNELFIAEYERLKKQTTTYSELEGLISLEAQNAKFRDNLWGALLERELRNQMRRETGSLPTR